MKILGVIPARFDSTRFPGKPLAMIAGKSMIHRVYEQAIKAELLSKVIVATDDERIFDHVKQFGGEVMMTSNQHLNGTSRCFQVLETEEDHFDVVVNIQGDEPFIDPEQIKLVASQFTKSHIDIATLVKKIDDKDDLFNENVVKAVFDSNLKALYFSRQTLPFLRGVPRDDWFDQKSFFKHIGIYAFRSSVLKIIIELPPSKLEEAEKLEQLRWLENGFSIQLQITETESPSVDTPEDLLKLTNKA